MPSLGGLLCFAAALHAARLGATSHLAYVLTGCNHGDVLDCASLQPSQSEVNTNLTLYNLFSGCVGLGIVISASRYLSGASHLQFSIVPIMILSLMMDIFALGYSIRFLSFAYQGFGQDSPTVFSSSGIVSILSILQPLSTFANLVAFSHRGRTLYPIKFAPASREIQNVCAALLLHLVLCSVRIVTAAKLEELVYSCAESGTALSSVCVEAHSQTVVTAELASSSLRGSVLGFWALAIGAWYVIAPSRGLRAAALAALGACFFVTLTAFGLSIKQFTVGAKPGTLSATLGAATVIHVPVIALIISTFLKLSELYTRFSSNTVAATGSVRPPLLSLVFYPAIHFGRVVVVAIIWDAQFTCAQDATPSACASFLDSSGVVVTPLLVRAIMFVGGIGFALVLLSIWARLHEDQSQEINGIVGGMLGPLLTLEWLTFGLAIRQFILGKPAGSLVELSDQLPRGGADSIALCVLTIIQGIVAHSLASRFFLSRAWNTNVSPTPYAKNSTDA
eukprot:c11248_g1_i1.p1 GENE.c11248_g1_i1~~c11248_g1_i1.p1  ORF type:complete len:507 (+),score=46.31 c11248_g1_i1:24-1544(+)